ncbi:MAG: sigma-70 family RNA polymerase sigma factor [Bacteroidota bacterium]|nr:sigma-70 family RNA polymerase sigma factor [Bacteroidota bacterium]
MQDNISTLENVNIQEDRDALSLCINGQKEAYGFIVKKYMRRAYFTALGLVKNHDDAVELSQDAFIRAYRTISRFDLQKNFFTWYYKILRNLCLNHLRNSSARKLENIDSINDIVDLKQDPSIIAERNDLTEKLWTALSILNVEEREIIILKDLEECSYKEIAERLEIQIGTVMSRLFNARKHLKEKFERLI